MFRIHKIYDATTRGNREQLAQVQAILRTQFPGLNDSDVRKLPEQLSNPLKYRFRSQLLVADDGHGGVRGFALLMHAPDLEFCYLDFISAGRGQTGGGIGGALYDRVREEALSLGVIGIFLECLPDDPALSPDAGRRRQNASRLRFYERYGARPIAGTAYETPLSDDDDDPPYLVFDNLGQTDRPLRRRQARKIVRAILERKYADQCPPDYVHRVVNSFKDDPVLLREPRYIIKTKSVSRDFALRPRERRIALVINDKHSIHHVHERGYVESPVRIKSILAELEQTELFEPTTTEHFSLSHIKAVHDSKFVDFLHKACENVPAGKSVYPYVFPIRNQAKPPKEVPLRAGYYCIDTFTPLNENAYRAAIRAVDCALSAAQSLLDGYRFAYALIRPPGHHAERDSFGGFCYFNSAAVAANFLSRYGKIAMLDVDYHHGNGHQDIFYDREDVLTISIHGHPRYTYPYFSGYDNEKGAGRGTGFNFNIPLPEKIDGARYREALEAAVARIQKFKPRLLVLSLGLDTAKGDPTGSWLLNASDFRKNGEILGKLEIPTLVVQEGGYKTRTLGINARNFFTGLWEGAGRRRPAVSARRAG